MRTPTYSELKSKLERELDIQDESFIDDTELMDYFNDAIDECESEIHRLYAHYFKKADYVSLVSGTASYSLPSDIYANKILYIQYSDGSTKYRVTRIKDVEKVDVDTGDDYRFDIENSTAGEGAKIVFYPTPAETNSDRMRLWYIRNANRLTASSSVCDIPEFISFVIQYVKVKVMEKESHPLLSRAIEGLEQQRQIMRETLDNMIPDELETLEMDLSFYDDFDDLSSLGE